MSADILLSTYLISEMKKKRMLCYSIINVSCQVLVFVPLDPIILAGMAGRCLQK